MHPMQILDTETSSSSAIDLTVILLSQFTMSFTRSLTEHTTTAGRPDLGSSSIESRPLLKRACHLYTVAGLHFLYFPVDLIMFSVSVGDFSSATQNFTTLRNSTSPVDVISSGQRLFDISFKIV